MGKLNRYLLISIAILASVGIITAVYKGTVYRLSDKYYPEAAELINAYYENSAIKNYKYIYRNLVNDSFRSFGSEEEFVQYMNNLRRVLGPPLRWKRASIQIQNNKKNKKVSLGYKAKYEKNTVIDGFILKETNMKWTISNYRILWAKDDLSSRTGKNLTEEDYAAMKEQVNQIIEQSIVMEKGS